MHIRSAGNRCAVHFQSLNLPIADDEAMGILELIGYTRVQVDLIGLARDLKALSKYRRGARTHEAPGVFDCSSFVKWLFACRGIWIPRYSIQQFEACDDLPSEQVVAGDLAFSAGFRSYYRSDPAMGIGHVGIVTDDQTVIHATSSAGGVVEEPLEAWRNADGFRGVKRLIPSDMRLITLECPEEDEVESSSDIRCKILLHLPHTA